MAVNDEISMRIVGRYQDQNIVSTLHYEIITQTSAEQDILNALIQLWNTAHTTNWLARHIDSYQLVGIKAFAKGGAPKTPAFMSLGTSGAVDGVEEPSVVCRTITLYSNSTNTRRRGRVMLSGGAASMFDIADGSVTTAEIALLTTLGNGLMGGLSGAGDDARLVLPSTATLPVVPIIDTVGRETPAVIRSRRIKQFLIG